MAKSEFLVKVQFCLHFTSQHTVFWQENTNSQFSSVSPILSIFVYYMILFFYSDWFLVMERIRDHPDFNHFFVEYPGDTTWMEANLFDGDTTGDHRIPFDVLSLPAAEVVFKNIVNQLHAHNHQLE